LIGPEAQIGYYVRALRTPRISGAFLRLGDQALDEGWSHEEYLAAVLSKEVDEREASGAGLRIKATRFPVHKALEDFNFGHQPSADQNLIMHLGTSVFLTEAKKMVLLGPPGIKAAKAGHRVLCDIAADWVTRLQAAHSRGNFPPNRCGWAVTAS
jgi:DNA replication protein DnaC